MSAYTFEAVALSLNFCAIEPRSCSMMKLSSGVRPRAAAAMLICWMAPR